MLHISATEEIIRSYVNRGKGGTFWLALRDFTNKLEVNKTLQELNYRMFRGAYTKQIVPDNINSVYEELNNIANNFHVTVDLSGLDTLKHNLMLFLLNIQVML